MFWLLAIFSYTSASHVTGQSDWIHFSSYLVSDKECMLEKLDLSFMFFFFRQYRSDFPLLLAGGWETFPYLLSKRFFLSQALKLLPSHFLTNSLRLLCTDAWCDFQSLHSADEKAGGLQLSVNIWPVAIIWVYLAFVTILADH